MRKLILVLIVLAGCRQVPMLPGISPYRIDIQQGNYVTQDMVAKLKPGMSKSQVRFALGTPLVVDPFHADRWDYIYVLQKGGRVVEQRRIIAVFDGEKLLRIEGDVVPSVNAATPDAQPDPTSRGSADASPLPAADAIPSKPLPSEPSTPDASATAAEAKPAR
jgi:outer membrane protein assembly factor BamE